MGLFNRAAPVVEVRDDILPHCDQAVLHAPGACQYCDQRPDLQRAREQQRIAFTGSPEEEGTDGLAPCPSTWFRSAELRDRWPGNRAYGA